MPRNDEAIKGNGVAFATAGTANRRDLSTALRLAGWATGATPNRLDLNQVNCEFDSLKVEINSRGIPEWDIRLNYRQYAKVQAGGDIWRSSDTTGPASGNTHPATNPLTAGQTVWTRMAQATGVPGTITSVNRVVSNGQIVYTWPSPQSNGSAISQYTFQWKSGSQVYDSTRQTTTPYGTHTLTGLTNGTPYDVRIRATNTTGDGLWSGDFSATPVASAPDAPDVLITTPGDTQVLFEWNESETNGSVITGYAVQWKEESQGWSITRQVTVAVTMATITGLTNGDTYNFRVQALSALGNSPFSSPVNAVPVASDAVPGVVTAANTTVGNGFAEWEWSSPESIGSAISSYTIQWKSGSEVYNSTRQAVVNYANYELTGLTNGTQYGARIRATNASGNGPWSSDFDATPTAAAPDQIEQIVSRVQDQAVAFRWSEPSNGGSALTNYLLQWKSGAQSYNTTRQDTIPPGQPNYTKTGLTNGTPYDFRLRAINNVGSGTWSADVTATPIPDKQTYSSAGSYSFAWPWNTDKGTLVIQGGEGGAGGGGGGSGGNQPRSDNNSIRGGGGGGGGGGTGGSPTGAARAGNNGNGTGDGGNGGDTATNENIIPSGKDGGPNGGGGGGSSMSNFMRQIFGGNAIGAYGGTTIFPNRYAGGGSGGAGGAGGSGGNPGETGDTIGGGGPGGGGGGQQGTSGGNSSVLVNLQTYTANAGIGGGGGGGAGAGENDQYRQDGASVVGAGGGAGGAGGSGSTSQNDGAPGGTGGSGNTGQLRIIDISNLSMNDTFMITVGVGGAGGYGGGGGGSRTNNANTSNGSNGSDGSVGSAGRVEILPLY